MYRLDLGDNSELRYQHRGTSLLWMYRLDLGDNPELRYQHRA